MRSWLIWHVWKHFTSLFITFMYFTVFPMEAETIVLLHCCREISPIVNMTELLTESIIFPLSYILIIVLFPNTMKSLWWWRGLFLLNSLRLASIMHQNLLDFLRILKSVGSSFSILKLPSNLNTCSQRVSQYQRLNIYGKYYLFVFLSNK